MKVLVGVAALCAVLIVPIAQADGPDPALRGPGGIAALTVISKQHPDNRAIRGPGGIASDHVLLAFIIDAAPIRPDDRPGPRGAGAISG